MQESIVYEEAVLSSMFLEASFAVPIATGILSENDFTDISNRQLFMTMKDMFDEAIPIEMITVYDRMQEKNQDITTLQISRFGDYVATAQNVEIHAKTLKEVSTRRKMKEIGMRLDLLADGGNSINDLISETEEQIKRLNRPESSSSNIKDVLHNVFENLEKIQITGAVGIPSGFSGLDELTGGFQNGDLIILAARTSVGKTSLVLDFCRKIMMDHYVGIISLEMSKDQIGQRLLFAQCSVNFHDARSGRITGDDWSKMSQGIGTLVNGTECLIADDITDLQSVKGMARQWKKEGKLEFLVIDYLQLINNDKMESRQVEISHISRSLKGLAKELDIPIIALSQLSRGVEQRSNGRPKLSDLRESGAIEQDADVVMFIYRPGKYSEEDDDGETKLILGKQRNGPLGEVDLNFIKEHATFREVEWRF